MEGLELNRMGTLIHRFAGLRRPFPETRTSRWADDPSWSLGLAFSRRPRTGKRQTPSCVSDSSLGKRTSSGTRHTHQPTHPNAGTLTRALSIFSPPSCPIPTHSRSQRDTWEEAACIWKPFLHSTISLKKNEDRWSRKHFPLLQIDASM